MNVPTSDDSGGVRRTLGRSPRQFIKPGRNRAPPLGHDAKRIGTHRCERARTPRRSRERADRSNRCVTHALCVHPFALSPREYRRRRRRPRRDASAECHLRRVFDAP